MTPDQWRIIFYLQVLKSYRDVLSADYQLQKQRLQAQIAEISDDSGVESSESDTEHFPESIHEIDLTIERLKSQHDVNVVDVEIPVELQETGHEDELAEEAAAIELVAEIIPEATLPLITAHVELPEEGEQTSYPVSPVSSNVSPAKSSSALEHVSSSLSSSSAGSEKSSTIFKEVTEAFESPPQRKKSVVHPPLFPHLIIMDNSIQVTGLDSVRLRPKPPVSRKLEVHCSTGIWLIPKAQQKTVIPSGETEIYARSIRRPKPVLGTTYPRPDMPPCYPAFLKRASVAPPPFRIEPYPKTLTNSNFGKNETSPFTPVASRNGSRKSGTPTSANPSIPHTTGFLVGTRSGNNSPSLK